MSVQRVMWWAAVGLAVAWFVRLVDPADGLPGWWRDRARVAALDAQLASMRREAARLRAETRALRDDPVAIEAAIHRELGYLRPDEVMVIRADGR